MEWPALAALVVVGLFAGTVNTLAGGGSLLGIPALVFLGLPANTANATNRVAVIVQSVVATWQFHRQGVLEPRAALVLLVPTSIGALLGAWFSVEIDEDLMRQVIGGAMLLMLPPLLLKPGRWLHGRAEHGRRPGPAALVGFFLIGAYGGFLQAGVGIFLLAGLVMFAGRDLVRGNAIKSLLVAVFTLPPLVLYVAHGLVEWLPGLALAAGSALGGWLGSRITVSWGPRFVRVVLVAVVLVAGSKLLGLW